MNRNIDDQIRTYYSQQTLSTESLGRLLNLIEKPEKPKSSIRMWQTLAMAATVALAFLAGVLFVTKSPTTTSQAPVANVADISNKIAQEVVMRHQNCSHIDFTETELAALGAKMTNLDFQLATPDVDMSNLKLQGGHYCVVNGQLALHATFIDQNGNSVSLLETKSSPQLTSLKHAMHEIEDIEVEMWQKDGVVVAMARSV